MKLNLLLDNPQSVQAGYVNIDPFAPANDALRKQADVNNFNSVCDDAEATEILVGGILSYFPAKDIDNIINYWIQKLRHGGILKIVDTDLYDVVKSASNRSISLNEVNLLLYGEQLKPWQYRKSMLSVNQLVDALKSKGLVILKKRVANFQFVVEAQRP